MKKNNSDDGLENKDVFEVPQLTEFNKKVKERYGVVFHGTNEKYYDECIQNFGCYKNYTITTQCGLTSFECALNYAQQRSSRYKSNPAVLMVHPEKVPIDYNGSYFFAKEIPCCAHYKIDLSTKNIDDEIKKGLEQLNFPVNFRDDLVKRILN